MLRGRTETELRPPGITGSATHLPPPAGGFPNPEQPYTTDERPVGVLFYQGKTSFFLPYHLLQTMRYEPERLILVFASDEVSVVGRGLHELYVQLAAQRVCRIMEQGERYASVSEAATLIGRIERTPRNKSEQQQQ
jgi:hypothetical protein